jgi:hypothetical protein
LAGLAGAVLESTPYMVMQMNAPFAGKSPVYATKSDKLSFYKK